MTSEVKSELDGDVLPIMSTWPKDPRKRIEIAFSGKIVMPEDFYEFFEFCYGLNRVDPLNAIASTCGLKLVGPFEFLNQKSNSSDSGIYHLIELRQMTLRILRLAITKYNIDLSIS